MWMVDGGWLKTTLRKCAGLPKTSSKQILRRSHTKPKRHSPTKHGNNVHQLTTDSSVSYSSDDDDYVMHLFFVFAHHHGNDSTKDDKYFTWLPVSISPNKTIKVLMQVHDSAATCNTLPSSIYRKISESAPLQPSHVKIFPYLPFTQSARSAWAVKEYPMLKPWNFK